MSFRRPPSLFLKAGDRLPNVPRSEERSMPKTFLTVATRKGTFVLESDDRRDWTLRGPYCEGWPVYHSIYDPNTGSIFSAAASEWHGSAIWRSSDLGALERGPLLR
jgi:hypothetical protein